MRAVPATGVSAASPTMTGMNADGSDARLIDGRFELLQRLGGGGMGLVWRARDNALHREVALKEVRPPDPAMAAANPEDALELRERVLREARSLARLQHPNVVIIHHIVDTADHPHPWLVMELVTGGSLADRLSRGPLTVPEAARIGRGVLSALRAAHAHAASSTATSSPGTYCCARTARPSSPTSASPPCRAPPPSPAPGP